MRNPKHNKQKSELAGQQKQRLIYTNDQLALIRRAMESYKHDKLITDEQRKFITDWLHDDFQRKLKDATYLGTITIKNK